MKQTITFLCLAVFALSISAQTVNIQGDPYGGNPYGTIQAAIDASTNSADVILIAGEHTEPITIGKGLTLRGTNPTVDIIQAAGSASNSGSGERVIYITEGNYNVTIENLGVRYGNINKTGEPVPTPSSNGAGIYADKVTGLLTLNNLIVEENYTATNGGAIGLAGTNADIINCTLQNNTSIQDGGAIIAAPNNGAGVSNIVNIKQSLIDSNTGRNGGGIYINGNNNFGNDYLIDVNIENSTISNNSATSASGGNGGGAIFSAAQVWTTNAGGDGSSANITLKFIHVTTFNNTHAAVNKSGLQFGSNAQTNFSVYNSIVVGNDDLATGPKAINLANMNLTDARNSILGGLINPSAGQLTIIDDMTKNNQKGITSTNAGLTGALSNEGGSTQVIAISESSTADDYCTADTSGITLPTVDQRGYSREGIADAGAYEFGATLSDGDLTNNDIALKVFPNPAKDVVNIKSTNAITSIKVYSILGSLEKSVYNQKEINVSNLSSGVHLMFIEIDGQDVVKRLIIE